MLGKWKAKKGLYIENYKIAKALAKKFENINFEWIPREQNDKADILSKFPLIEKGIISKNTSNIKSAADFSVGNFEVAQPD